MASLSSRQSPSQPTSGRSTITQLGRAQQPRPTPLSSRVAVGQMGVGRRYTGHSDLLTPRQLHLPVPPLPDFARLRADAERIRLQIAAQGGSTATVPAPAPAAPRSITPKEAGYPIPFLSPADQARRVREQKQIQERALAEYNQAAAKAAYLPAFLREALSKPQVKLTAKPVAPAGPDSFMPNSFWQSQNPKNIKGNWAKCCATCKAMILASQGYVPLTQVQLFLEKGKDLVSQPHNATGIVKLDDYLVNKKPVMIGVHFKYGTTYNNDLTTEHFVVIVGRGVEKGVKYYRFFDVGTISQTKGTDPRNRLYYDSANGSYTGKSYATGNQYIMSQLRFK